MQIQDQTQSEGENLVERFLELGVAMQRVAVWIDHSAGDDARKQEACRPDRTLGGVLDPRVHQHLTLLAFLGEGHVDANNGVCVREWVFSSCRVSSWGTMLTPLPPYRLGDAFVISKTSPRVDRLCSSPSGTCPA
jgi:hypothetical protein